MISHSQGTDFPESEKNYFLSDEDWLKTDWYGLSRKMMVDGTWGRETFEYFRAQYRQEERYYHNFAHIGNMLKEAAEHPQEDSVVFKLSVWFHDVIYRPVRGGSEKASAKKALKMLSGSSLTPEQLQKIEKYILATTTHTPLTEDSDEKLLLDLDLMILGTPPEVYDAYASKIRDEYGRVPNFVFKKGRKKALNSFLEREFLFFGKHFRKKYEKQARENLLRESEVL